MHRDQPIALPALMREIARYLAAVETFRVEDCEPSWRPERALFSTREPARGQSVGAAMAES